MEPKNHMSEMEQAEGDRATIERKLKRQDEKQPAEKRKAEDEDADRQGTPSA